MAIAVPLLEEVLEGLAEEVDHHEDTIVGGVVAEVVELDYARWIRQCIRMPWKSW